MLQAMQLQRVEHDLATEQQWKTQTSGFSLKVSALGEVTWQMDFLKTVTSESPIHMIFLPDDPDTISVKWWGL